MQKISKLIFVGAVFFAGACASPPRGVATLAPLPSAPLGSPAPSSPTGSPTDSPVPPAPRLVPSFEHIAVIVFENKEYGTVIHNPRMPYFNILAASYTLLNQHYAVTHPSLPNYIAMMSGDTHGITQNCEDCSVAAPSLPDLIEASGRTWKTYQESMPEPCFLGSTALYVQKHNPFIYFDPIRLDPVRCSTTIVPLEQLEVDIAAGQLPNFLFVTPNLCNDAHDCPLQQADEWLDAFMDGLVRALDSTREPYLIVLTWDEGQGEHGCCGLAQPAGGRIPTVLVSPQVKNGFEDETQYTHYSLLKTISEAWGLEYLGHAADENNVLMLAPWK